jgi:protein TonB
VTDLAPDGLARLFAERPSESTTAVWALLGACILHVTIGSVLPRHGRTERAPARAATQLVDIDPPPPPPPPPAEEPPPAAPATPAARAPAAAPPPAQAAAVLTQKEDPSAPADLTNTIVVGAGETYVGGTSSAHGSSQRTVTVASTATTGTGAGPSPVAPAAGPDRSQRARLAEGGAWSCPFPAEADVVALDHAVVTLRITVDPTGAATAVAIAADPGHGFGREARACALSKRYAPALDREGRPIAGTSLVNVRFDR